MNQAILIVLSLIGIKVAAQSKPIAMASNADTIAQQIQRQIAEQQNLAHNHASQIQQNALDVQKRIQEQNERIQEEHERKMKEAEESDSKKVYSKHVKRVVNIDGDKIEIEESVITSGNPEEDENEQSSSEHFGEL